MNIERVLIEPQGKKQQNSNNRRFNDFNNHQNNRSSNKNQNFQRRRNHQNNDDSFSQSEENFDRNNNRNFDNNSIRKRIVKNNNQNYDHNNNKTERGSNDLGNRISEQLRKNSSNYKEHRAAEENQKREIKEKKVIYLGEKQGQEQYQEVQSSNQTTIEPMIVMQIRGLDPSISQQQLQEICQEFGPMNRCEFVTDGFGKRLSQGIAYIQYFKEENMDQAISQLDGTKLILSDEKNNKDQRIIYAEKITIPWCANSRYIK